MPRRPRRRSARLASFLLFAVLMAALLAVVARSLHDRAGTDDAVEEDASATGSRPDGGDGPTPSSWSVGPEGTTGRVGEPGARESPSAPEEDPGAVVPEGGGPDSTGHEGADRAGTGDGGDAPSPETAIDELRERDLTLPVDRVAVEDLRWTFEEARGDRVHEALDILAPKGTPVRAVEDGRIEKLFESVRGGLTIYQFDPARRFAYYYAHLDRYAPSLREGQEVARGEIIGYVGTSGNAPPDTPHLHFAVFVLTAEKQWWKGTPVDPFLIWRAATD